MATACIAIHSLVDFSLQIQAIAAVTTIVLSLPFAAAQVPPRSVRTPSAQPTSPTVNLKPGGISKRPAFSWIIATSTAAVLIAAGWQSWRLGIANYLAVESTGIVAGWEASGRVPTPEAIDDQLRALRSPIALSPGDADYRESEGSLYYARASMEDRTPAQRQADYRAALASYLAAAERSPRSGYVWSNLMLVKYRLDEIDTQFYQAFDRAVALSPYEPAVQAMVVGVGFSVWRKLPPDAQGKVIDTVRRGWVTNRPALMEELEASPDRAQICRAEALPLRALCKTVTDVASERSGGGAK